MQPNDAELAREADFFSRHIDPIAAQIREAGTADDAYDAVVRLRAAMFDDLDWLPRGGGVFTAWADLEDLYETGKTPIEDAHAALRDAATDWLQRPMSDRRYVDGWIDRAKHAVSLIVERDGDWWSPPSS